VHLPLPEPVTVAEIASRIGGDTVGDGARRIARLASIESAGPDAITFLTGRRHARAAAASSAGAFIVSSAQMADVPVTAVRVVVGDPYAAYARLSQWFASLIAPESRAPGIHPTAHLDPSARLGTGVRIGPGVSVGADVSIGADSVLDAGCAIGAGVRIGEGARLYPNVTIYDGVRIGSRAVLHAGVVIGADGFGFAPTAQGFVKIAQLGSVSIGDDVEVGANSAIDRGSLDDTVIGDGVKIDNLVQIGHNVRIGEHTVIAGCAGIAGSATIGRRCMIGGGVGVAGHITICDGTIVGGMSLVERTVTEPGFYTGAWPLQGHAQWERTAATLKQLPQLRQRLRALANLVGLPKDPS
jgi:UDP-3-O-[3-hydroxymyristoyl] glucosamine N-acyltransferase